MRAGEFIPGDESILLTRMRDLAKRIQLVKDSTLKEKLLQLLPSIRTMSDIDKVDTALYQMGVQELAENKTYIGNCTEDDVIEHIFGDATNFAQAVEEYGDEFTVGDLVVEYDPTKDVHYFYMNEDLTEHEMVWSRAKTTTRRGQAKLKWRCTSGKRKGRVVPNVADCDKPIDVAKRATMKRTRAQTYKQQARRSERSKRINTASRLIRALNKARKR